MNLNVPFYRTFPKKNNTLLVFDVSPWKNKFEVKSNYSIIENSLGADVMLVALGKELSKRDLKSTHKGTLDLILSQYENILFSGLGLASMYDVGTRNIRSSLFRIYNAEINGNNVRCAVTENPATWTANFTENAHNILLADINFVKAAKPYSSENIVQKEIDSLEELKRELKLCDGDRLLPIVIDLETTGLLPWKKDQKIISFAVSTEETKGFSILVDHPRFLSVEGRGILEWVCSTPNPKIMHNSKFDYLWIKYFYGIDVAGTIYDTMLLSHLLNENMAKGNRRYTLAGSIVKYLNLIPHKEDYSESIDTGEKIKKVSKKHMDDEDISTLIKNAALCLPEVKEKDFSLMSREDLKNYGTLDAVMTLRVFYAILEEFKREQGHRAWEVIARSLHDRVIRSISAMEWNGLPISVKEIQEGIEKCEEAIKTQSIVLEGIAPGINFLSKKELTAFLITSFPEFDEMIPKDEHDDYILDKNTLKVFIKDYPWLENLISLRHAYKAKNTYFLSFLEYSSESKIHFDFQLHGTATGRLSCNRPNLQNVPKVIDKVKVKTVFKSVSEKSLVNLDLSNAEIRMMACYSKDEKLIENLNSGLDFHSMTASQIFPEYTYDSIAAARKKEKRSEPLTDFDVACLDARNKAKAVSFGIPYGTTGAGMAKRQGWTTEEAEKHITAFFTLYPGVKSWIEETRKFAREHRYVETYFGRRRRFPILSYTNSNYVASRVDRQAVNFLIQSTSSDWLQYLIKDVIDIPGVTPHITVHDSIVFSYEGDFKELDRKLDEIFIKKPSELWPELMVVPILYEYKVGSNYGEV